MKLHGIPFQRKIIQSGITEKIGMSLAASFHWIKIMNFIMLSGGEQRKWLMLQMNKNILRWKL